MKSMGSPYQATLVMLLIQMRVPSIRVAVCETTAKTQGKGNVIIEYPNCVSAWNLHSAKLAYLR